MLILIGRLTVPGSGDELQRLAETLNQMLQRIEEALDRVSRFSADATPNYGHRLRYAKRARNSRYAGAYPGRKTSTRSNSFIPNWSHFDHSKIDCCHRADRWRGMIQMLQLALCPDIEYVLKNVLAQVSPIADEKQVSLHATLPQHPIWVSGIGSCCRGSF